MDACLSLYVGPAMNWRLVHGEPDDAGKGSSPRSPKQDKRQKMEWMEWVEMMEMAQLPSKMPPEYAASRMH